MVDPEKLRLRIFDRLSKVIDPETGVDVVRMRLIEDFGINEDGFVTYKFRPSSPLCPIAVPLSLEIRHAVSEVEGVNGQDLQVVGFALGEELDAWLRATLEELKNKEDK